MARYSFFCKLVPSVNIRCLLYRYTEVLHKQPAANIREEQGKLYRFILNFLGRPYYVYTLSGN